MSIETKNIISEFIQKKLVILILVSFLAIQNLIFQVTFRLNFPYSVDFQDVFVPMYDFIVKGEFTFLVNKGIHVMLFPKLISLPNFYFNSFDVVNLTYVYWIVISLTVFITYLIIKQTDRRLIWTIIPISAFLYSPLTTSGYFMLVMLEWYFPLLGIVSIIYLLNKENIKTKIFTSSIFLAFFSTFSIVLGVVSWIAGLAILFKSISEKKFENKKWIFLWLTSASLIGFFYMTLTSGMSEPIRTDLLFSYTGFSFITNFISSSFRLKYEFLMILVGSFSIILSIVYGWYFVRKEYLKQYFPWFVLLVTAFSGSIITALGRMQLDNHFGNEPYYSTISQLFQIGLIVLTGKLIIEFNISSTNSKKKIITIILILLLISQMVLLVPSYYSGWQRGEYYSQEKTDFVNCFSLSPKIDCLDKYHTYPEDYLPMINYLIENKLSIFDDSEKLNEIKSLEKFRTLKSHSDISIKNNFESINDEFIQNNNRYDVTQEVIKINGWFDISIDSVPKNLFLLIDGKPIIENHDMKLTQNKNQIPNYTTVNWSIFYLSGYIDSGCHTVQLAGIIDDEKIYLENELTLCK